MVLYHASPHEKLIGKSLDYSYLNLRPRNSHKLQFRSARYLFLGYSPFHHGYICYNPLTKKRHISHHVVFNEEEFPLKLDQSSQPTSPSLTSPFRLHIPSLKIPHISPTSSQCSCSPLSSSPSPISPSNLHSLYSPSLPVSPSIPTHSLLPSSTPPTSCPHPLFIPSSPSPIFSHPPKVPSSPPPPSQLSTKPSHPYLVYQCCHLPSHLSRSPSHIISPSPFPMSTTPNSSQYLVCHRCHPPIPPTHQSSSPISNPSPPTNLSSLFPLHSVHSTPSSRHLLLIFTLQQASTFWFSDSSQKV